MRMCQRFYCDKMRDRFCCRDCRHYVMCNNPCENDPSRCGLEDTGGRVRQEDLTRINRGKK